MLEIKRASKSFEGWSSALQQKNDGQKNSIRLILFFCPPFFCCSNWRNLPWRLFASRDHSKESQVNG
jgi:hypothetical protein